MCTLCVLCYTSGGTSTDGHNLWDNAILWQMANGWDSRSPKMLLFVCNAQKAGEPVICSTVSFSVSYFRRRLVSLASSSPLPVLQSFHKHKKHSMGMGCHSCEWIVVAAQSGCIWGKGALPVRCALRLESMCIPFMQTLTSWVVSAETFNVSVLLLSQCMKWG